MNRFRFRLQSVLKVRRAREDEASREFGTAAGHLARERQLQQDIESQIDQHDRESTDYAEGSVSAARLAQNFSYARELEHRHEKQVSEVGKAEAVTDEKREIMVDAMKERKTLERLKERQRDQHEQAERREEQAFIDETATQRFARPDDR